MRQLSRERTLARYLIRPSSSGVERFLGKEKVASSNLALGFPKLFYKFIKEDK